MKIALHWFRRDLRLHDNAALHAAAADVVVPIFIFDPAILKAPDIGAGRVAFLLEALRELEKEIAAAGGKLIVRHGAVGEEMARLLRETRAATLHYNRDYEPYARARDDAIDQLARSMGVEVHSAKDGMVFEPDEVLKADGTPYAVFTPYSNAWRARTRDAVLPAIKFDRPDGFSEPKSLPVPTLAELGFSLDYPMIPAGEAAAREQLKKFAGDDLLHYASRRNFPGADTTSRLSPHLRFGTLSPRTVLAVAAKAVEKHPEAKREADIFVNEIIWRDFYRQVLWHFPHVADSCFKPVCDKLKWENDERLFAAWCEGRTGYPIVDAGMRQLNTTGWMHNRVRMIVAAFLTKDLLISWQWGERYFMQKLFDGDLASNNGGWQWSASTGTDAQPYFRIFNPAAQAEKFDPAGDYIRKYVPEIDRLDYPLPIVDHAQQRLRALALFKQISTP
jgi:deoxyribodipyrimidine photo-lyase